MIKRSGTNFIKQLKGLNSGSIYENFPGTSPETIYNAMCDVIRGQLQRMENIEGSGWVLESIDRVILSFSKISAVVGSSYRPLPMRLELKRQNGIDNINNSRDDNDHYCSKYPRPRDV